jgi:hypothetical protein
MKHLLGTLAGIALIFVTLSICSITFLGVTAYKVSTFLATASSDIIVYFVVTAFLLWGFLKGIRGAVKIVAGIFVANMMCHLVLGYGLTHLLTMIF